jgi:hypothetical protein
MSLLVIVLVAALIIGAIVAANSKSKVEEVPEPIVKENFYKVADQLEEAPVKAAPVKKAKTATKPVAKTSANKASAKKLK